MEHAPILQIGKVFYCALTVLGIPANVITLLTLQLRDCGLSQSTNIYLTAMATADLLVLVFYALVNRILVPHFKHVFYFYTLGCRLNSIMIAAVIDCSVWLTVFFTFDRFIAICFQRFRRRYCSPSSAALVVGMVYLLTYSRNLPYYFSILPYYVHNNLQIGCKTNPNIYSAPAWRAFYWLHTILTPLVPYVSVALLNLLTIRHILVASQIRRGFRRDGGISGDPEMQSRRRAMVLLFAASASFISLWMATVGLFLFSRITNTYVYRDFNDPFAVINETARMLRVLNCCTSTCMYALTQSKFRDELRKAVRCCINIIIKFTTVAN
ncbi:probable G-protein coupled receptor 139 [Heterodontus francisci]|uniref:probable G-protein coupled receptor 139 n=1 Tax=Heterodontus francisci TaxID=7792 RepID=UPI00355C3C04